MTKQRAAFCQKCPRVAPTRSLDRHSFSFTTARFKHTLPRKSSGGKAARLRIILAAKSACKSAPVTGGINEPHPEASPMAPHATAGYAPTAVLLTGGAGFIGSHGK